MKNRAGRAFSLAVPYKNVAMVPHKTLEERLVSFYGKPVKGIDRIQSREVDWGGAEGGEAW